MSIVKDADGKFFQQTVAPNGTVSKADVSRLSEEQIRMQSYKKLPDGSYAMVSAAGGATPTDATVKTTAPVTIGAVTYAIGTPLATINAALATSTNGKLTANPAITGATKTKITYDANGLVTAGADATNGDILTVTPITIAGTIYPIGTTVSVIENALAAVATLDWKITGNAGTVAGTNFIGTTDAVDLVTKTNSAERMRVTAAGNVGINTSNPQAKIHIQGNGGSAVVPAAGNGIIISEGGGGGARIYLEHSGGLTTTKVMLLETTSGLTKFSSLSDNGGAFNRQNILTMNHVNANVGIGTQTAQNKLDIVTGVANTSGLRLTNLTSASPATTGGAIGVDVNGDVVRIASTAALAGYTSDAAAAIGGVAIGGQYFVIVGNSYGMSDGAMKVRRN
jgi:hypothetical protein